MGGCIAFMDEKGSNGHWDKFYKLMMQKQVPCDHDQNPQPVPMSVTYENVTPNPIWKAGHQNGNSGTCTAC